MILIIFLLHLFIMLNTFKKLGRCFMIEKKQKQATLERLLASKEFADSRIQSQLLTYLVRNSIKGITPKEITIASEVCGKDKDFNPSDDSYVRSAIYHLRKKLQHYYDDEGRKDPFRITIPKGHYHVVFERARSNDGRAKTSKYFYAILGIAVVSILIHLYLLTFHSKTKVIQPIAATHSFWQSLIHGDKQICLVVGDLLLIREYDDELKKYRAILDPDINNYSDFEDYMAQYPDRDAIALPWSHLHMSTVPNLVDILPIFHSCRHKLTTKWSMKLRWEDLVNNHIVYLGNVRSLHILKNFFIEGTFRVEHPEIIHKVIESDTIETYRNTRTGKQMISYALVARLPGPNDNDVVLFVGTEYPARNIMLHKFTQLTYLQDVEQMFTDKYNEWPRYFEIFIQVTGYERVGFNCKVLSLNKIESILESLE
jgi:hypothetical protein